MNIAESLAPTAATMSGGFFVGVLIGYALKEIIKLVAIVVGLFLAGLAYLHYQQIATLNWNKLQLVSEGTLTILANAIIQIPGISGGSADSHAATTSLAMSNFGIPLTGSMSAAGFTLGFIKG